MYNFAKNRGGFGLNFKRDTDRIVTSDTDDNCRFPTDGDNDESHGTVPVPAGTGNVTVSTRAHHYRCPRWCTRTCCWDGGGPEEYGVKSSGLSDPRSAEWLTCHFLCWHIRKPTPCVYRYIRSFKFYLRICVYILRIRIAICKKKSAQLGIKKIKMPVLPGIPRCGGWYDCCCWLLLLLLEHTVYHQTRSLYGTVAVIRCFSAAVSCANTGIRLSTASTIPQMVTRIYPCTGSPKKLRICVLRICQHRSFLGE